MPEAQSKYLKVLSNLSVKGQVKIPLIGSMEEYDNILVIDEQKRLKTAKPKADQGGYSFYFSDYITSEAKNFSGFFPSQYHVQGNHHCRADIYFHYAKLGRFVSAYLALQYSVLVSGPIANFTHISSPLIVETINGARYSLSGGLITYSEPIDDMDITIERNPLNINTFLVSACHHLEKVDNLSFTAFVKIYSNS